MTLGQIKVEEFLSDVEGEVYGELEADAKDRYYEAEYDWDQDPDSSDHLLISKSDGTGDTFKMPKAIDLDRSLTSFFGFYSGDGAKGAEDKDDLGRVNPSVSVSQIQPNLIRFTVTHLRILFPGSIRFVYSLGEDSALFMAGEGEEALREWYDGSIPEPPSLTKVCPDPNRYDKEYVEQERSSQDNARRDLAFYHFHKDAMQSILETQKKEELATVGITPDSPDRVTASLRRPYKKGAREPGGSSRSDELHVGGVNGAGELFLKIMSEIEDSIFRDDDISTGGLVEWRRIPSQLGSSVNVASFFNSHPYGQINGERPELEAHGPDSIKGKWKYSRWLPLSRELTLNPLWCYTSGLYLAEGTTSKDVFFSMYRERPSNMALSFTSSEGKSMELLLRALSNLFKDEDCLHTWKLKVGSQYFPELVVVGLKNGVPVLRGGQTGQGKLRTMEISLELKQWALQVAPALEKYEHKYSHVEPTGAGVPRIDFSASSTLSRWYFPLLMFCVFGPLFSDPERDFS